MTAADVKWSEGACSGTVYSGDEKVTKLMAKVIVNCAFYRAAWNATRSYDEISVCPSVCLSVCSSVRQTCGL